MKAIRVHQFGGTDVLCYEDVPSLQPGSDDIIVDIKAVGINPVDTYIRSGQYSTQPQLPYTPGADAAGIIKKISPSIDIFDVGQRVYVAGSRSGTYAQESCCRASHVYPLPEQISFDQGAAIGIPYATAYYAMYTKARCKKGETILIHGASGGVGLACVEFAKLIGMNIIATAGTSKGMDLVKKYGAQSVLNHTETNYFHKVIDVPNGQGVDVIIEMLSNVNLAHDLELVAKRGRVVIVGCRGHVEINPRLAMVKDVTLMGMLLMNISEQEQKEIHQDIVECLKLGYLNPMVGRRYALSEADKAHASMIDERAYGKIVLIP